MEVVINGVRFAPIARETSKIGIAISTHNRPDTLAKALENHLRFLPSGAKVFVIDDGSTVPAIVPEGVELIRFGRSGGIVHAKNASLRALMNAGCEELFYLMMTPGRFRTTGKNLISVRPKCICPINFLIWPQTSNCKTCRSSFRMIITSPIRDNGA